MIPATFATHALPMSQQLDGWRDWYASVLDMQSLQPSDAGFRAKVTTWTLCGFGLSRVCSPPVSISRTKALLRRNPVDHWCISFSKRGQTAFRAGDQQLEAPARVPFVFSLGEDTASMRSQDRLQLYLARDSFQGVAAILDAARGTVIDTPEGHLFVDYMLALERNLPHLPDTDGPKLARAIQAMISACLAPAVDRAAGASSQIDFTQMEKVRQAVGRNLRSPALGPEKLCREAATSRSQLYRLLEGEGGVVHYIQRRRLSESFSMLCDVSNGFSIGKVAEILCFADGSSFSRAFRREFGMSPSDVRAASLEGFVAKSATGPSPRSDGENFSDCLRKL